MQLIIKLTLFILCLTTFIYSQIIPEDRKIDWKNEIIGIPNGIPQIDGPIYNVINYGADPSGTNDSKQAILDAITDAHNNGGGVVYIPEGSYKIIGTIRIGYDNIILRGDGYQKTKLHFYDPDDQGACIAIVKYNRGDWQEVYNYNKGDSILYVQDASLFSIGNFGEIQQENDAAFMYTNSNWNQSWAQNAVGQLFVIKEVNTSQNYIKIDPPLHYTFKSDLNPQIRPQGFVKYVGIENLYIDLKTNTDVSTILLKNAAYCWIKRVESNKTNKSHVDMETAFRCEIRESYFHKSYNYGGGGHGYGVNSSFHTTNCLIEDNIFDSLRHAMLIHLGANGNIYGYNYSTHPIQSDNDTTNFNQDWNPPDISIHGHFSYQNLFESNSVNKIGINDYWGPAGPGNTYFRNMVKTEVFNDGITYQDHARFQNIIGNITYQITDKDLEWYGKSTSSDLIVHGNVVNGSLQWSDSISDHNLPYSYYKDSNPSFFGELNWPVWGPEFSNNSFRKIPAQIRYKAKAYIPEETPTNNSEKNVIENKNLSLKVYPNPFNPILNIECYTLYNNASISIYSIQGKIIFHKQLLKSGLNRIVLKKPTLSSGIFFIKLKDKNKIITKKVLLIK